MRALLTILIVVIVIGGIWFLFAYDFDRETVIRDDTSDIVIEDNDQPEDTATATEDGTATNTATGDNDEAAAVVTYSAQGFSPQTVTVRQGEAVRFVNESTGAMWVASDEHPTHTLYSGTTRTEHCAGGSTTEAFDQCEPSTTFTFTFNKTGTWTYHNHTLPAEGGTVVVQ